MGDARRSGRTRGQGILVGLGLVAACAAPPAAPERAPAPKVAEGTKKPSPPSPPSPPPAPVVPPDPEAPWKTLPNGVVPRALVSDVTMATQDAPLLERVKACDRPKLADNCNYGGSEILGFHEGRVAMVHAPESGHPEVWPFVGEIADLEGHSLERKTITKIGELEDREYTAARLKGWRWFGSIARAGFTPAKNLVRATADVPRGEVTAAPVAFLRAPLTNWMVYAAPATTGDLAVQLVEPDNQRTHPLGSFPIDTATRCMTDDGVAGACDAPRRYDVVLIDAVALDPGRTRMVVMLSLADESGRAVSRSRWLIAPLPAVPAG